MRVETYVVKGNCGCFGPQRIIFFGDASDIWRVLFVCPMMMTMMVMMQQVGDSRKRSACLKLFAVMVVMVLSARHVCF